MFSKKYIVVIFLFVLLVPAIDSVFNVSKLLVDEKSSENRALTEKPEVDINKLDYFPSKYDLYYNDHFMLRDLLINVYNHIKAICFNVSPIPDKAFIGKENWLYMKDEELTYNGSNRFSDSDLVVVLKEFERRKEYLKQRNCSMYIYIIPPKFTVYPEYVGKNIKRNDKPTQGGQVAEYFKKNSDIPVTYLLPALLKAKSAENPLLFCTTDNHWSDYGAYIGYKEIISQLSYTYNQLKPLGENDLEASDTIIDGGNIAMMMNMEKHYTERKHRLKPAKPCTQNGKKQNYPPPSGFPYPWDFETQKDCSNKKLPKALVIHDSFMLKMIPFFAENFSHSTYIFDAWQYKLNENIVEAEKPNIVVYVIFEPLLKHIVDNK